MYHASLSFLVESMKIDKTRFKVCHSSAFQTISVRSDYVKIINYSDSILANLNVNKTARN